MKTPANSLCLALCLGLLTATTVVTISGCAGDRYNRSTGEHIDDESLRIRVNDALSDNPDYKFKGVNVTVFKGTVQLSGFVDVAAQRSKADEIAKQIEGVKDVVDSITVTDQNASSNGSYVDDKTLASRVNSALKDNPDYKFDEVQVAVLKGTVQLSGFVNTADQKSKAGRIAKEVQGIQDVVNNITVKDKM